MRKILVIRFSSLGDVVLTLPVFRVLRSVYPDAEIMALVKEQFADVLFHSSDISSCIVLKKGQSIFSLAWEIRQARFDTVIDLHGNWRSWVVNLLSGAQHRVRYQKAAIARRLYVGWRVPSAELQQHTLDRYLATLRKLDPQVTAFRGLTSLRPSAKILVVQTAFLGDAVLTTPLLRSLKEHFPQTSLTVLCTAETQEVFAHQAGIDQVIVYDKRGKQKGWNAFWEVVRSLKTSNFDLALLPHRSFKSAWMVWLAGIPRRIGFSSSEGRWWLTETIPFEWGTHDVDRNLGFMQALGIASPRAVLSLQPDLEAAATVKKRLFEAGCLPNDIVLGIHAGSVWATKRWLPERFAELADRAIRELGVRVIFVGGPKDRAPMATLLSTMKEKALNWVGETNLRELIALIARCDAFLTNDSGPMHLAVASHVPTVAVFGPTTRELGFFPYGPGHQVIEKDLSCRPCGLHGSEKCPLGHFQCMRLITVDEVLSAVRLALARRSQKEAASS